MIKRKLSLPLLAAIAGMALSSFSVIKTETNNNFETGYFWYNIQPDGTIAGSALNSSPETKSDAMPGGSQPLTSCADQITEDCLVGCTSSTLGTGDTPDAPTQSGDNRIHKSNN